MERLSLTSAWTLLLGLILTCDLPAAEPAAEVLELSGVKGGLCVQVGCEDEKTLAGIARGGRFLAHGLFGDEADAEPARRRLADAGLAGVVTAESFAPGALPHADNMVNLLVVEDLPAALAKGLKPAEIVRVLAPRGVACLGAAADQQKAVGARLAAAGMDNLRARGKSRRWLVYTKPLTKGMDEWTHFNHAPDGNLVSRDTLIGRPNRLQWIAGPQWGDRREKTPANGNPFGMVSAGGRNYYLMGRAARFSSLSHEVVARDAFNGVILWTRPVKLRWPQIVAAGGEVFLKEGDKIVVLDGATGKPVRSFGDVAGCRQIIHVEGKLLAVTPTFIQAFSAETGKRLWRSKDMPTGTPVVHDGRIYLPAVTCLNLADGAELWHKKVDGQVLFAGAGIVLVRRLEKGKQAKRGFRHQALAAGDGRELWTFLRDRPAGAKTGVQPEAYLAGGLVWIQSTHDRTQRDTKGFHNPKGGTSYRWEGLDPKTGRVRREFLAPVTLRYRCHKAYATDLFFIGYRPVYFTEWRTGKVSRFDGTRMACQGAYGLGNGMFYGWYTVNKLCQCIRESMGGVTAFDSDHRTIDGAAEADKSARLRKGPAPPPAGAGETPEGDWPTYRRDMQRTARAPRAIRAKKLSQLWHWPGGPPPGADPRKPTEPSLRGDWRLSGIGHHAITPPTIAEGRAFVSLTHAGQVVALSQADGKVVWRRHLPGRLDAPPTIHRGLCLVGCHDGWVYCLRADDGRSVWRFRAAPAERRIVAFGQVESAWPVVGGVLVVKGIAYALAGRTTEADGGLHVHALKPRTGEVVWSGRRVKPDDGPIGAWNLRSEHETYSGPADLLSSDGQTVAVGGWHAGRFTCLDGRHVSNRGYRAPRFRWMQSRYYSDRRCQYSQVAYVGSRNVSDHVEKKRPYIRMWGKPGWQVALPAGADLQAVAIAGDGDDAVVLAALSTKGGAGEFWLLSAGDGAVIAQRPLPAAPAWEGLAAADGKAYVSLRDGTVVCLGAGK